MSLAVVGLLKLCGSLASAEAMETQGPDVDTMMGGRNGVCDTRIPSPVGSSLPVRGRCVGLDRSMHGFCPTMLTYDCLPSEFILADQHNLISYFNNAPIGRCVTNKK
jgi:hypothetical protein